MKPKPLSKKELAERADRDRRAAKRRAHVRFVPGETDRNDRRSQGERRGEDEPR